MATAEIYTALRRQALGWTTVFIGASIWLILLASNVLSHRLPTEWLFAAVATVSVCGMLYVLRENHLTKACHITVTCLWASNAILALHMPLPGLYLFGLVIALSSSLLRLPAAVLLATLSTLYIVAVAQGPELAVGAIISAWGNLLAGVVISRGLFEALETINRHHEHAIQQMNQAREHRAELASLAKALKEATESLWHANGQLLHAREAADEARRLKAQFAANVSHELRTPINLVIGYSEVMVMTPEIYGAPLPPTYRGDIHAIYSNANHLRDLINDILDISQIEASRLAMSKEKTDLRYTLLETAKIANDLVCKKGLEFYVDLSDDLPEVWIDRTRIRQVVINLLANAVRFTDKGAITLRASQAYGEIIVSVCDTGIGIAKHELSRVFEEFYQAESLSIGKQDGTGLGLTLSLHVIQHHGGKLWAESEGIPGRGSTFSFTLPMSADTKLVRHNPASTATGGHSPKCVVVFDDDIAVGQLFKRYLNTQEVVITQSEEDAIRLTQMIKPSAVVMDRVWHDTPFEGLLAAANADTAMIFCPMPSGRRTAQEYGAADYLVKPITRQSLLDAILALESPVRKVLVVDDERDITRMLARMLQSYNQHYSVWQANNGEDALAIMVREHPDVVLLDIQMPTMDGISVIHRMKQDPLLQQIPIIIASAQDTEESLSSALEGKLTVVRQNGLKPIDLVNCVEAVVNALMPSIHPMPPGN
ncbi:MAG: response regulator [Chloroflexi bacterium]|nr:response regulator [Chloroflexota bacterium]